MSFARTQTAFLALRRNNRRFFANKRTMDDILEREANNYPSDLIKQNRYLRELNNHSGGGRSKASLEDNDYRNLKSIIRRVESGKYAIDRESLKEYFKAATCLGQLDRVDFFPLISRLSNQDENTSSVSATGSSPAVSDNNSPGVVPVFRLDPNQGPLNVVIAESTKSQIWRFLKMIFGTLIVVSGLSVLIESLAGNIQKGLDQIGPGRKVEPVKDIKTSFEDVKGCEEVKEELAEIIMYLKDPAKFTRLGAKLPKGVLIYGPPGTGKTLLARAIAGEAGVPFIQSSGSEFEEMFVGVGARRIRDLFSAARKLAPCILFIDEIDAVGSKRHTKDTSSVRMTLNQLLVELDGFEQNNGVVVICATNFAESLDKALTRPGRLDKMVAVPVPDLRGRTEILEMYGKSVVLSPDVSLDNLAKRSVGMTGADLANIINIAAVKAAAENYDAITNHVLDEAFDRVVMGLEKKSPIREDEKKMTSYHEGGHAIVALNCAGAHPVHKVSVIPRGNALGITYSAPDVDKFSEKSFELEARLAVAMGGRVAEELMYGTDSVSGGCSSDLRMASSLARLMVMNYGMGGVDPLKPVLLFLDSDDYATLSDRLKGEVDERVERLLKRAYDRARAILKEKATDLSRLSEALMEFETMDRQEIDLAITGRLKDIRTQRKLYVEARQKEKAERATKEDSKSLNKPDIQSSSHDVSK